jgi:hypothetical protein
MDRKILAAYFYKNYDRWFAHVRSLRKRRWSPNQVLNIPTDLDAEVAVQNAAGTIMLYAEKINDANRDAYIYGALDWEVGNYWRRRRTNLQDMNAAPDPVQPTHGDNFDAATLESRLEKALRVAKEKMSPIERTAFGACWRSRGNPAWAKRIFHALHPTANYYMARDRAMAKVRTAILHEFAERDTPPLCEACLIELLAELRRQLGFDRVYAVVFDIFCNDLPDVPELEDCHET